MDATILRYDILLLIQILGAAILVGSLFHSGLTLLTVFGGVLVLVAIAGIAIAAVLDESDVDEMSIRDSGRTIFDRHSKR